MHKNIIYRIVVFIIILGLAAALPLTAAYADETPVTEGEGGTVPIPGEETEPPVETPIPDPTVEPTQEPQATEPPQQEAGKVNITIYAYSGGKAADGYTVRIDQTKLIAGSDGKVEFKDVTVEQHSIALIDKNGAESTGTLYLSRGGSTSVTNKAMGGTYGVDVAGGATQVYMNAHFNSSGIDIDSVSESAPKPPAGATSSGGSEAAASATPQTGSLDGLGALLGGASAGNTLNLTAAFKDENEKAIGGMNVHLSVEGAGGISVKTNNSGILSAAAIPLGAFGVSFDEGVAQALSIKLQRGDSTGIAESSESAYTVNAAANASKLYLSFAKTGDRFVLTEVSEKGTANTALIGMIAVIVIIVIVVIVIVSIVKKHSKKRRGPKDRGGKPQSAREPIVKRTGGANKFEDRSRM